MKGCDQSNRFRGYPAPSFRRTMLRVRYVEQGALIDFLAELFNLPHGLTPSQRASNCGGHDGADEAFH